MGCGRKGRRVVQIKINVFRFWLQMQKIIIYDIKRRLKFFQAEKKFSAVDPAISEFFWNFLQVLMGEILKILLLTAFNIKGWF